MALSWLAVEATTGRLIADLPLLDVPTVKSVIGRYDSTTGALPIPEAPENWLRATQPRATNLILLADNPNDPAHGIPLWGGQITKRTRDQGDAVKLALSTGESYMDCRYVGDQVFSGVGQNTILNTLMSAYVIAGKAPNVGLPLRVSYSGAGALRDRTYQDLNNMTVYAAAQNLMGVIGGPEWTWGWEWQTSPERITPVMYISSRLGTAAPTGLGPNAMFELPGSVTRLEFVEDYSNGRGANTVIASSSGTTTARPQSAPQTIADTLRPTVEHRFTPSTSISDVSTLNSHALNAVMAMDNGTNTLELSAIQVEAPQLGLDWVLGDDVGYQVTSSAFPNGISGVARAIGWEIALSNTPILTPFLTSTSL